LNESRTLTVKAETARVAAAPRAAAFEVLRSLRSAERVVLFYFMYLTLEAMVFPVSLAGRATVAILNLASSGVLMALSYFGREKPSSPDIRFGTYQDCAAPATSTVRALSEWGTLDNAPPSELLRTIRDWFPALVILLVYRESGMFYLPDPAHHLDYRFARLDTLILHNGWLLAALNHGAPWLQRYLEFSYTLCYPLVPLGVGALYALRRWPDARPAEDFNFERAIDQFWTAVLLALCACYALWPFFPSTPPRVFFHDLPGPAVQPLFRKLNLWILGHYGIESSVFPSGHVAAVTAVCLSVRRHWPRGGVPFVIAAASVAVATIIGRYHYAADALAGAFIGSMAFLISKAVHQT
jgi:hypothetical protein